MPSFRTLLALVVVPLLALTPVLDAAQPTTQVATPSVTAPGIDAEHSALATVLQASVHGDYVDYRRVAAETAALNQYRVQLAQAADPSERAERLSFYINAYNALTLALVLELAPDPTAVDDATLQAWSVTNVDGFWTKYAFEVAGQWLTLDAIEHQIIRSLGEPRIHFLVNCASESCPPLLAEPVTVASLDAQLAASAAAFVASDEHVRITGTSGAVAVNPILTWFAADFGGAEGVVTWLVDTADGSRAQALRQRGVTYFDYDWALNHRPR